MTLCVCKLLHQLRLHANGTIYKDKYAGWYCTPDETFLTDSQLKEENGQKFSIESGHPVEWSEEENYMFRLSKYRDDVIRWAEKELVDEIGMYDGEASHSNLTFFSISAIAFGQRNFKRFYWTLYKNHCLMYQSPDPLHVYIGEFVCQTMSHIQFMCGWMR